MSTIEEIREAIEDATGDAYEYRDHKDILMAAIDELEQLRAEAEKLRAEAAAMRKALTGAAADLRTRGGLPGSYYANRLAECDGAISTNAGTDILERLRKAEAETQDTDDAWAATSERYQQLRAERDSLKKRVEEMEAWIDDQRAHQGGEEK